PRNLIPLVVVLVGVLAWLALSSRVHPQPARSSPAVSPAESTPSGRTEVATLAGGCFWCMEAVFQDFKGVQKVVSGFSGRHVKNPSYEELCTGTTGHAEAVQITFDPAQISYAELLDVFFHLHDPTTLNRQGNDVG